MLNVKIEYLPGVEHFPRYATDDASGLDLPAQEDYLIFPEQTVKIAAGFKLEIPRHHRWHSGYRWEAQIRMRSGNSFHTKLRVANSPGTIDNLYRQELGILITNTASIPDSTLPDREGFSELLLGTTVLDLKNEPLDLRETGLQIDHKVPAGTYFIKKGQMVAQLVFQEVVQAQLYTGTVDMSVDRGGGFGHTDNK